MDQGPNELEMDIFIGESVVAVCAVVMVSDFQCFVKMILRLQEEPIIIN